MPIGTISIGNDIKSELTETHVPHDYKVFNKVLQLWTLRYPKIFFALVIQFPEELTTSEEWG